MKINATREVKRSTVLYIPLLKMTAPGGPAGCQLTHPPGASTLPLQCKGAGTFILARHVAFVKEGQDKGSGLKQRGERVNRDMQQAASITYSFEITRTSGASS